MISNFPKVLNAGDTISVVDSFEEYKASEYDAVYILMNTKNKITFDSQIIKDIDNFTLNLTSLETDFLPGDYTFNIVFKSVDGLIKRTVGLGQVKILEDISKSVVVVEKSWSQKALENIRANIAGTATPNQKSYEFDGRKLENFSLLDLLQIEKLLKAKVREEEIESSGRTGKGAKIKMITKNFGGF